MNTKSTKSSFQTNTIDVLAGDSAIDIERMIMSDISNTFCVDAQEFDSEYPGEKPAKYRIQVSVTAID